MRAAAATAALVLVSGAASAGTPAGRPAAAPGPVRIYVRAGLVPGAATFDGTRTFTAFAEEGHIDTRYTTDRGPAFEAALAWRFAHRLALGAAVAAVRRREAASFSAAVPHPLYFGAPRSVTGEFAGRRERETAVHLDLALLGGGGRVQWSAFAGPSLLAVEADLVDAVHYAQAYPFDTVTLTGTDVASSRGHAAGFNAGLGLDCQIAPHLALAALARASRATVTIPSGSGDRVRVTGGGVHLAAGLRFDF